MAENELSDRDPHQGDIDAELRSVLDLPPETEEEAEEARKPRYYCTGADRKTEDGRKCCDHRAPRRWVGIPCPKCGYWYDCRLIKKGDGLGSSQTQTSFAAIKSLKARVPIPTGIVEVDRILGGGFLAGSTLMFGGKAGAGKSSLLLQLACNLAVKGVRVFFVSGEMTAQQNLEYGLRLMGSDVSEEVLKTLGLYCDTDGIDIQEAVDRAIQWKAAVFLLDSVQLAANRESKASMGSADQVDAVTQYVSSYSQKKKVASVFISHLTKEEDFKGAQTAQHAVDGLLMMERTDVLGEDGDFLHGTARNDETIIRRLYWKEKSRQGPSDVKVLLAVTEAYRFESVADTVRMRMAKLSIR